MRPQLAHFGLLSVLVLSILPGTGLSQIDLTVPLRIQASMGWNRFVLAGVESDLKNMQNHDSFLGFPVPLEHFGKDFNFGLTSLYSATDEICIGISLEYFRTDGYFESLGYTSIGYSTTAELEYIFYRISPQVVAEYSHQLQSHTPVTLSLRFALGPSFVNLRKDANFSSMGDPPPYPFGDIGYHLRGEYKGVNPEYSARLSAFVALFENIQLIAYTGWTLSTSKDIEGSFGPANNVPSDPPPDSPLLKNINLKYEGLIYGAGIEFRL